MGIFADRAKNARDRWDEKLRARGHRLAWHQVTEWPSKRYLGICSRCGGELECSTGRASSAGYDIRRSGPCRPQERPRRALLRPISGGQ